MPTLAPPMTLGAGWLVLLAAVLLILVLGGLYSLVRRDNPRQEKVDAEREHMAEEVLLNQPMDFQSEFRAPREPYE
jgi:hypothetical protein